MKRLTQVRKRDGRLVPYDARRIAEAIWRAAQTVGGEDRFLAEELAGVVGLYLERTHGDRVPGIEDVQDAVERVLIDTGHAKTAKAFILHRQRRTAAKARLRIEEDGGDRPAPLVGGDTSEAVSRWSKARVAAALVAEAGLDPDEADEVARAVEERVLSSGLPRVASSMVRALVDSELFTRGHARSRERQRVVGLPKHDLARRLAEGFSDRRRGGDPETLAEALGEELLRQHVLEEVLPPAAAEAHRLGDLHAYDLGAPARLASIAPSVPALLERHLKGETTSRAGGARRVASALSEAVARYGPFAARVLTLEDLNVHFAPFVDRLDEDALLFEAREFLLSPAVLSFPRRGGLLRLEIGLAAEVPDRLRYLTVPPPAAPGRSLGDFADAAQRTARAFLQAACDLRREGAGDRLPALTVTVPRDRRRDAAARALLREALAAAAEAGEPLLVLDDPGSPSRGTRWHRVRPEEAADPLRFDHGDVSAASVTAINLVAAALRAGSGHTEDFFSEVDRLVGLAVEVASARRDLLRGGTEHPDGTLYAAGGGEVPLVDVEGAAHLVEPVGADRAAGVLAPEASGAERQALRTKVVRYVQARAAEEGGRRGLAIATVEAVSAEAATRLALVDTSRFPRAAAWWDEGRAPSYLAAGAPTAPAGVSREPAFPGRGRRTDSFDRVRRRVETDQRPPLDDLLEGFEEAAADPAVAEYALDPWPRRILRGGT